ncbi:MAG: hypothetical protein QOC92_4225 [Acidimicrobiaceae bacterium]|jgi:hypothetical protein
MVLMGFVLLAAAGVLGIDLVAQNRVAIDIEAFGQGYATSLAMLFTAGVVTGLVAALALLLLRDGAVRRRRMRLDAKRALATEQEHVAALRRLDAGAIDENTVDLRDRDQVLTF